MSAAPILETERLRLRAPRREDFEPYASVWGSDRSRFMGGPYDPDRIWLEFSAEAAGWVHSGFGYWTVTDRISGGYLGSVGFAHPLSFPERELGWMILPEAEGSGIAFEAAKAVSSFAFDELNWEDFVSYVHPDNARSIRLAERLGATLDPAAPREEPDDLVFRHRRPA